MISTINFSKSSRNLHCPVYLLSERNAEPKLTFDMTCLQIDLCFFIIYSYFVAILVQSFEWICNMVVYGNMLLYVNGINLYFETGAKQNSHLVF